MTRLALLVLAIITAGCDGILPEIRESGVGHILQDHYGHGPTGPELMLGEEERLEPQEQPEDAFHLGDMGDISPGPERHDLHPHVSESDAVTDSESVHASPEQETHDVPSDVQFRDLMNNIDHGCTSEEDCGTGRYCFDDLHNSKCLPCKEMDVSCTKDEECCGEQLCVWGQCSPNATRGQAGSTCRYQSDCSTDLCCALHKVLLFPVCSAKPIERERCLGASNHLAELLSWDVQDEGPRTHCPCVGDLRCQHLGRGSMCLKGEDPSEEDLTDTLYTEIDYII